MPQDPCLGAGAGRIAVVGELCPQLRNMPGALKGVSHLQTPPHAHHCRRRAPSAAPGAKKGSRQRRERGLAARQGSESASLPQSNSRRKIGQSGCLVCKPTGRRTDGRPCAEPRGPRGTTLSPPSAGCPGRARLLPLGSSACLASLRRAAAKLEEGAAWADSALLEAGLPLGTRAPLSGEGVRGLTVAVVLVAVESIPSEGDLGSWLMPETGREEPESPESRGPSTRAGAGQACGARGRRSRAEPVLRSEAGRQPGVPLRPTTREPRGPGPWASILARKRGKPTERRGSERGPPGGQAGPPARLPDG